MGTAKNMLLAYSKVCLELPHSTWENANAKMVVKGRAVKNPAKAVFFAERKETKLIKIAATNVFPIKIHIIRS